MAPKLLSGTLNIHPLSTLAALFLGVLTGRISVFIYLTLLLLLYSVLKRACAV